MNDEKILADLERENLRLADKGLRSLAWFIDVFLLSFALKFSWQVWILKISYDTLFVWYYGSSIGKILCKMRVVSVDLFDKPSFLYALLRACGKYIGESLLFITYVFGFGDSLSRTLHDRLAKTLVIAY